MFYYAAVAHADLLKSAVSVALPTIIQDLHGSSFIWVGSAYTLAGTAFIPLSGGLAQVRLPYAAL